jgi:hypothetical protein
MGRHLARASEANAALLGSLAALAGPGGPRAENAANAQALSGDETKRRMALVNADREIVLKIMTEPGLRWEPQSPPRAENAANFFRSSTRAAGPSRRDAARVAFVRLGARSRRHC